jgi:hypothetical protein
MDFCRRYLVATNTQNPSYLELLISGEQISLPSSFYSSREKDLCRQLETQTGRITQLSSALESNKEAQRIVLETKESVLRSLLRQNAQISQEVNMTNSLSQNL